MYSDSTTSLVRRQDAVTAVAVVSTGVVPVFFPDYSSWRGRVNNEKSLWKDLQVLQRVKS